jgi:hypothetical protein
MVSDKIYQMVFPLAESILKYLGTRGYDANELSPKKKSKVARDC